MRLLSIIALLPIVACGGDGRAARPLELEQRLRRRMGPHWRVLSAAESLAPRLLSTDLAGRAGTPEPAAMGRRLGWQRVLFSGEPLDAVRTRSLVATLSDPATYELDDVLPALPAACSLALLARRGEDARLVGIDLKHGVLLVSAGNRFQRDARFRLSQAGLAALRPLAALVPEPPR